MALWKQKFWDTETDLTQKTRGKRSFTEMEDCREDPNLESILENPRRFCGEAPLDTAGSPVPLLRLGPAAGDSSNYSQAKALIVGIGPRKTHGTLVSCRSPIGWRALGTDPGLLTLPTWQCVPGSPHSEADQMINPNWTGIPSDKDE